MHSQKILADKFKYFVFVLFFNGTGKRKSFEVAFISYHLKSRYRALLACVYIHKAVSVFCQVGEKYHSALTLKCENIQ